MLKLESGLKQATSSAVGASQPVTCCAACLLPCATALLVPRHLSLGLPQSPYLLSNTLALQWCHITAEQGKGRWRSGMEEGAGSKDGIQSPGMAHTGTVT